MKLKDHLIRFLLIFAGLAIPSAISTAASMYGQSLGGLGTLVVYAPFFYFIYCVYKGKIGPKLPQKPTNNSVPVTPEMLASTPINSDLSEESFSDINTEELYYICPRCDSPVPASQGRCYCGHILSSDLPKYRLCPECNSIVSISAQACDCGHHFNLAERS